MLWASVSVYSIFSHRVLSNVKCSQVMLPLPVCHSHNLRMVISLPSNSSNFCEILHEAYCSLDSCGCNPFPPPNVRIINPADEGAVVQRRVCQCYRSCKASDHVGMTVCFQTWPNLIEFAPVYLALWQPPLWKSNQVNQVCVYCCCSWLTPASTRRYLTLPAKTPTYLEPLVAKQVGQIYLAPLSLVIRLNVATKTTLGILVIPNK